MLFCLIVDALLQFCPKLFVYGEPQLLYNLMSCCHDDPTGTLTAIFWQIVGPMVKKKPITGKKRLCLTSWCLFFFLTSTILDVKFVENCDCKLKTFHFFVPLSN